MFSRLRLQGTAVWYTQVRLKRETMKKLWTLWCLLLLCGSILADETHTEELQLPADFVQVSQPDDLKDENWYAFGGINLEGHLVYMSNSVLRNGKLSGCDMKAAPTEVQRFTNDYYIWRIVRIDATQIALKSLRTGEYLTRKKENGLGLRFLKELTPASHWRTGKGKNGHLILADPVNPERALSVSSQFSGNGANCNFDNYEISDTPELLIYKKPGRTIDIPGHVDLPKEGQRLALFDENRVRLRDGSSREVRDVALADGTLAPAPEMDIWQCRLKGGNRFVLERDGAYLGYELCESADPSVWQINHGYICTDEDSPRYLCYDAQASRWQLLPPDLARTTAHWGAVAESPYRQVNAQGVCRLSGGWSAPDLSALDWQGIRCLDLTALALPVYAQDFVTFAETPNLPVFVAESSSAYVPSGWNFVVSCGTSNRLLRPTTLTDRSPFYTDRPFEVSEGQLEYVREAVNDEGWQTLCLPFAARSVSAELAHFTSYAGGELVFAPSVEVRAGTPYLVRVAAGMPLRVVSSAGKVVPQCTATAQMCGTYERMSVRSGQNGHYYLSAEGVSFDEAAPGSSLPPFRAYLRLSRSMHIAPMHIKMSK